MKMYNTDSDEYIDMLAGQTKRLTEYKDALETQVSFFVDILHQINTLNSLGKTKEIADTITNALQYK